jgi:hypothetical protein
MFVTGAVVETIAVLAIVVGAAIGICYFVPLFIPG